MKDCNNRIFVLTDNKNTSNLISKILEDYYEKEKNNLVETACNLTEALEKLSLHYKDHVTFDVFVLDLNISLEHRNKIFQLVNHNQANYECIVATATSDLPEEEIRFIKEVHGILIPDISEITLFPLLPNVIQRKFDEMKYLLVNRIDSVLNSEIAPESVLDRIVNLTMECLDLRICWISILDNQTGKFDIAAVTGFGKHEQRFREIFDLTLEDNAVISESARNKVQVQYQDVQEDYCPFKYRDLAKEMGLKSILVTPIFDRRGAHAKTVMATLNIYTKSFHIFHEDELELTKIIGAKITAALFTRGFYRDNRK